MKTFTKLAAVALSVLATGIADAQTTIRIVGSNGDRSATQQALSNLLGRGGDWKFQGDKGAANSTGGTVTNIAAATNSNYGAWNGTYSGTNVIVKVSFLGAAGAVGALAVPQQARFVHTSGTGPGAVTSPYAGTAVNGVDYDLGNADFGFSTNFQDTTPFSASYGYQQLTAERVGASPIVFVASPGFPGDNISTQLAQNLYLAGSLKASLFTGNSAHANSIVFALGRNTDAGQRFATYGEIGLGTAATVKVWQPTVSGQLTDANNIKYSGTATSQKLWPIETISGVSSGSRGNGGYDTGGNLAPYLTVVTGSNVYTGKDTGSGNPNVQPYPNATAGYYIGYVTIADYNTRIAAFGLNPAPVLLKYNGVDYSAENVRQGKYTLWVYNNILKPEAGLTGIVDTFHDDLRDQILNVDATANGGLRINDPANPFKVERFVDGGLVTPL
jgi:hypothetical protein